VAGLLLKRLGRGWQGNNLGERGDDCLGPGPVFEDLQLSLSAAAGEPSRDREHPEPQQFRLREGEVAGQGDEPEPGGEVGGDRDDLQPGLVDLVLP
jgi:hypothetical protein